MNVVIINDNAHVNGGAAKVAIQEAVGLADRGHKIYFVCAVEPIARELIHPNISICSSQQDDLLANPNPAAAFVQGWWNTRAAQLTGRIVSRLKGSETIVHLHVWSRALSASTIRAAIDSGIPVVCTLHDFMLACPNGTFFNHTQQQVCHLRPLSAACVLTNCDTRSYAQKLWRVGKQVIQKQMGKAPAGINHFIVHSRLAGEVMKPYLPQDCTLHSLPIYIESNQSPPAQPETNHNLVCLGRLVREKGVLLAANAAAAEGVPLTFVGSGPLAEQIQAACPEAIVTGWVDHATSVQYLRQARALVFPSLWYETLGLVVLEAAAHGIPSLVPDTSSAREIVLDGVTGLHFKSGDELDLRTKMKQLQDADLVRSLGREAYKRFWSSDYCSLDTHVSSLGVIYQKIVRAQMIADKFPALPVEVQRVG
ncbi:glycosyltransferase family 4 protein [Tunturiibacter gelidiferens]|uniref:glycosyltransferase family 4 protein n=1 Tax=Tunturiibacter gelidiferens TaxID=3069689 RepID=UPI003D9B675C